MVYSRGEKLSVDIGRFFVTKIGNHLSESKMSLENNERVIKIMRENAKI